MSGQTNTGLLVRRSLTARRTDDDRQQNRHRHHSGDHVQGAGIVPGHLTHARDVEWLNDREKEIISRRFGFDGGEEKTLDEVGKQLGFSRERIRQLQNSALSKLRHALNQREDLSGLQIAA